jgi:hypothetical protein
LGFLFYAGALTEAADASDAECADDIRIALIYADVL